LELSFLSPAIYKVTIDKDTAYDVLGSSLATSYFSLVSDMRNASFLGELFDPPTVSQKSGSIVLNYVIQGAALLEVEPMGKQIVRSIDWEKAFRIRLLRISFNGAVLA
jgi:hypothetical protein